MSKTDEILKELQTQRDTQGKIFDKIEDVRKEVNIKHVEVIQKIGCLETKIEVQKVKSGFIGAIGGAIPMSITLAIMAIKGFFTGNK